MYIERKKSRNEAFWIIRFIDGEEKQDFVQSISDCISNSIKEEYREEYRKNIVDILNKAQHNGKYDEEKEESAIISSSQIANMLTDLICLCSVANDIIEDYKNIVAINDRIIENYKNIIATNDRIIENYKNVNATNDRIIESFENFIEEQLR